MYPCRLHRPQKSPLMMSGNDGRKNDDMESTLAALKIGDDSPSSRKSGACGWQVVSASVRGAIHERHGEPNQDALSWWSSEGDRPLAVLCVADGHGGSEYTRSHIGACHAVTQAQRLLVSEVIPLFQDESNLPDLAQFKRHLMQQLPKLLVSLWRESVVKHANGNPIQEDEHTAQSEAPVERLYGATLLAALLSPEFHLYIQLGDGDILTVSADGEITRPPFEVDSHLFANHTTSLCSREAWRFVRIHFQPIVERPPVFVMLATDGYSNSFAEDADFIQVAKDLYTTIQQDGPSAVAGHLHGWLKATSEGGSGDDISAIIAANWIGSE